MGQKIGVWGVHGFAGEEVVRILSAKRQTEIVEVGKEQPVEKIAREIGYAILALPTGESLKVAPELLKSNVRVIDLSGAFRLRDVSVFEKYYGIPHPCPEYLDQAVYGLTEKSREQIRHAALVANPGCYATAVELALLPLAEQGLIERDMPISVEAVSGYTGAGKHAPIPDKLTAYKPNRAHQHVPEIEQTLGLQDQLHFYPRVAPWPRGIEATIRLNIRRQINIVYLYKERYGSSPCQNQNYVHVVDRGAERERVIGTNFCHITPRIGEHGEVEISVAIDNLGKGAAGQAVQNLITMNPSFGDTVYESE